MDDLQTKASCGAFFCSRPHPHQTLLQSDSRTCSWGQAISPHPLWSFPGVPPCLILISLLCQKMLRGHLLSIYVAFRTSSTIVRGIWDGRWRQKSVWKRLKHEQQLRKSKMGCVVDRRMPPQRCPYVPVPRTCEYVTICCKGTLHL